MHTTLFVEGDITAGKQFITTSPLNSILGGFIAASDMRGTVRSLISFSIPIESTDLDDIALRGLVVPTLDRYRIAGSHLTFTNPTGYIYFDESSVSSPQIVAEFDGNPVTLQLATVREPPPNGNAAHPQEPVIKLTARATHSIAALTGLPDLMTTAAVTGQASFVYDGTIPFRRTTTQPITFTLSSDLVGVAIGQSQPLGKEQEQAFPLQGTVAIHKDRFSIVAAIESAFWLQLHFDKNQQNYALSGGEITIGQSKKNVTPSQGRINVFAHLSALAIDPWIAYAANRQTGKNNVPVYFVVTSDQLRYRHYVLNKASLTYIPQSSAMGQPLIDIRSNEVDGLLTVHQQEPRYQFKIERAIIGERNFLPTGFRAPINPATLPLFTLTCTLCQYQQRTVRDITVYNSTTNDGTLFSFSASSKHSSFDGEVFWQYKKDGSSHTDAVVHATSKDFGALFTDIGYPKIIKEGQGDADLSLQWAAAPYEMDVESLSGEAKFNLTDGALLSIAQNESQQLLSLLNIAELPKRLIFDFNDITDTDDSETIFDKVDASFLLKEGIATTKAAAIQGSFGVIKISGAFDFIQKNYDLNALVVPDLLAALPIISGLLGGLPWLFSTWILNETLDDSDEGLNSIGAKVYSITGPFNNPIIKHIEKK